jgi:hypothetical protein
MSRAPKPWNVHSCGKVQYRTEHEARMVMALMPAKPERQECRAYQCHLCGRYHLTSKPLREESDS